MTQPNGERWNDLQTRVISAIVMLAVGVIDIWLGGAPFTALVVVLTGVMIWELATITAPTLPQVAYAMAVIAVGALSATLLVDWHTRTALLALPLLALAMTPRNPNGRVWLDQPSKWGRHPRHPVADWSGRYI